MSIITINTWKNNYIIAHDPDSKLSVDLLNKVVISLTDKIGDSDQKIKRVMKTGEYVSIAGHANIKYEVLTHMLKEFLVKFDLGFNWEDNISDENVLLFKKLNILPAEDPFISSMGGGTGKDTHQIELGIEPLVDALNMFDGIRTFGSCEGHNVGRTRDTHTMGVDVGDENQLQKVPSKAYVSWTACNIDGLNYSTFLLKNAINKVFEKRGLIPKEGSTEGRVITLSFNTGYWKPDLYRTAPLPGENYYHFEYEYNYDSETQKLVFDIIADIAEDIVNEKYQRSI